MAQKWANVAFGISPVRLSDEQWAEMVRYSDLPDKARTEIEIILGTYRHFRDHDAARPAAHQMRTYLKNMRKDISALRKRLETMDDFDAPFSYFEHEAPGGLARNTTLRLEGQELRENTIRAFSD
jgi:hypothetical protein